LGEHWYVIGLHGTAYARFSDERHADLFVSAVNALPSLLDAVEERDRLREALGRVVALVDWHNGKVVPGGICD